MKTMNNPHHSHYCILSFIFALLFPCLIYAQDLTPEKIQIYTTADGLPNNAILCMDQDKKGNLWIGTDTGASRFDGKSFKNYGAKNGFSGQRVWAILCDSKGNIWFGTRGGLFRVDGKEWKQFTKKDGLTSDNFLNGFLYEDRDGNIWGGSLVTKVFKYTKGKFNSFHFNGSGAIEDHKNNLYVADYYNKNIRKFLKKNNSFNIINNKFNRTMDISIDANNTLWVADDDYIAKSNNSGNTFSKFKYSSDTNSLLDMFIDKKNQIWIADSDYIIRFDGSKFHYYDEKNGLFNGAYYIFQDKQGHLWFCCGGGLAKFDNIPPKLQLSQNIPKFLKSQSLSFQFKGDDGKFGSPPEDLRYEYKFADEKKWNKAKNGLVNLDKLQNDKKYKIQLRVTDGFQNSSEKNIFFTTDFDALIPTVSITNQDEFLKPVNKLKFKINFKGQDDRTDPKKLRFRYKLEKDGKLIKGWQKRWKYLESAPFYNLRSGDYTFFVQAQDTSKNKSEINKLFFSVDSLLDKPKIALRNLNNCYFVEKDNRPVQKCTVIEKEILSGRIFFEIQIIDKRPEKQQLLYSVQLLPLHRNWKIYRDNNFYKFNDLPDNEYHLKIRAKDSEDFVSEIQEYTFKVKGFQNFPQTQIDFHENFTRGKIVGKIVNICWKSDKDNCLFSYQLNNNNWSVFHPATCFEIPVLPSARHSIRILAKNDFGIEPMPAVHEFDYERIPDLPIIKLISNPSDVLDVNSLTLKFQGEDDMEQGDKTPENELLYSWRFFPLYGHWSKPSLETKVEFNNLKNGSYFFQVKVRDKKNNESVAPAEKFFEIRVVPFYKEMWFIWSASAGGIILAAILSILLTLRQTKKNIYEQRFNPYVVGEAVHDPEMFFGRKNMIQDIFQSLKSNSLCLTGERRIGKTTILEHVDKNTKKPQLSFFCNLESVKQELFFSRIMQHLTNKIQTLYKNNQLNLILFEKKRHNYDDIDFEDDIETILDFLKKNYHAQVSIIMCLDEIDATQGFSNEIHQSLRNVFQTYQGSIRLVAAGVSIRRGEWQLPTSPWYNFFEFKNISALDIQASESLINKPVKGFYSYKKDAVDFILQKTDGKPFYIQKICKKAISKILNEKRRKVFQKDVIEIYEKVIRIELNQEFEIFWEELEYELQKLIIQAADNDTILLPKEYEIKLLENSYNSGHRVITVHHGKIKFSTIFWDWLKINYLK
ncbi:Two component regulator three Y domain-containing protein [Candidatus Magnetomoraceae bacterium gMMP-15]